MNIIFGADHAATQLKESLKEMLAKKENDMIIEDISPTLPESGDDYPDYAFEVALRVAGDTNTRGVLMCDTGVGMSIAANKIPGAHAALVHNSFEAKRAREHNNANIIVFGSELIRIEDAFEALLVFLHTPFSKAERHQRRIQKIEYFDKYRKKP